MDQVSLLPDQAVVDGAAAGEEPRFGGGASRGGGQQVGDAGPDGRGPGLGTHTGPGAETETERAAGSEPVHNRTKPKVGFRTSLKKTFGSFGEGGSEPNRAESHRGHKDPRQA